MKIFLLGLLFFVQKIAFGQKNNFTLTCKFYGAKVAKAKFLTYAVLPDVNGFKLDSNDYSFVNNEFTVSGYLPYPEGYKSLWIMGENNLFVGTDPFFVDSGNVEITFYYNRLKNKVDQIVKGSITNDEYMNEFLPKLNLAEEINTTYYNNISKVFPKKYGNKIPDSITQQNLSLLDSYFTTKKEMLKSYIKSHPKSHIPLTYLGSLVLDERQQNLQLVKDVFACLSADIQHSISGIKINAILQKIHYDYRSATLSSSKFLHSNGDTITIDFSKKKYTLLEFWISENYPVGGPGTLSDLKKIMTIRY